MNIFLKKINIVQKRPSAYCNMHISYKKGNNYLVKYKKKNFFDTFIKIDKLFIKLFFFFLKKIKLFLSFNFEVKYDLGIFRSFSRETNEIL